LNRVRFPSAVRAGSSIRARIVLQSMRDVPNVIEAAIEATYSITVEIQGLEKPGCAAELLARYYS
jgi:acyl dehydratase